MKKLSFTWLVMMIQAVLVACPTCERQQPKILRGVLHGTGPESKWDYLIVAITIAITLFTLYFSIKWLIKPGEKGNQHIKYFILNTD